MSIDWRVTEHLRIVRGKRAALATLDAQLAEAEADLELARGFEGDMSARLAEHERRVSEVSAKWAKTGIVLDHGDQAEHERRVEERGLFFRERDDAMAAATVVTTDSGRRLTYCRLRVTDVERMLHHLRAARGRASQELADVEGAMSAGELVASGRPAPQYVEHVKKTEQLRYGRFVVAGGAS